MGQHLAKFCCGNPDKTRDASAFKSTICPSNPNAFNVHVTASRYPSSEPSTQFLWRRVKNERTDSLLVCYFEGVGEPTQAAAVASFCAKHVSKTFHESAARSQHYDPSHILRSTLEKLDSLLCSRRFGLFNSGFVSNCGAVVCIVLLDLETLRCTVANVGDVQCILGNVVGSFNAIRPKTLALSTLHTLDTPYEKVRFERRAAHLSAHCPEAGARNLTRILGVTSARSGAKPFEVSITQMVLENVGDISQTLLIAGPGFFSSVSPWNAVLRAHLYDQMTMKQQQSDQSLQSPAMNDHTAKHLFNFALRSIATRNSDMTKEQELQQQGTKKNLAIAVLSFRTLTNAPTNTLPISPPQTKASKPPPHKNRVAIDVMSVIAKRRWDLVRMHVAWQKHHRREVFHRWHNLVSIVLKKAKLEAKMLQDQIKWHCGELVTVTPSRRVLRRDGTEATMNEYNINVLCGDLPEASTIKPKTRQDKPNLMTRLDIFKVVRKLEEAG